MEMGTTTGTKSDSHRPEGTPHGDGLGFHATWPPLPSNGKLIGFFNSVRFGQPYEVNMPRS